MSNQAREDSSAAEPPMIVSSADDVNWDAQADVIVVGLGGAGATAAIEAREQGAEVLVVERFEGGGATAKSGGVYYAGQTPFQKDAGVTDTVDDMFAYLSLERDDAVSEETLRRFCEDSPDNIAWLVRHGVGFEGSLYPSKTNMPPADKFLFYSGNEKVPAFAAKAKPAPRGHRFLGKGWTGYAFYDALRASIDALGIPVRAHSRVTRLVVDGAGAVIGVEILAIEGEADRRAHQKLYSVVDPLKPFNTAKAEKAIAAAAALEARVGTRRLLRARAGVILATGGFVNNLAMVRRHMPFLADRNTALLRLGSMGDSGAGIELGQSAGGAADKLNRSFLGRMIVPPYCLVKAPIVNRLGKRFINEDAYNAVLGNAIMEQPDGEAWLILDKALHRTMLRECVPTGDGSFKVYRLPSLLNLLFGGTKKAGTIAGLAAKIGVPAAALEETIASMNGALERGEPDAMGKNADYLRPVGSGPYRAINTSIGNPFSFCIFFTLGGLRVDEARGLVLHDDNRPIEGLYAAGRVAKGIPSDGYISGLSLADCVFSGRRAGREAALRKQAA